MTIPADASGAKLRRARSIHERDTVDLLERGLAGQRLGDRRLSQGRHALRRGRRLQVRGRPALEDHLAHARGQVEQFGDRRAAAITGAVAVLASGALEPLVLAIAARVEPRELEQFRVRARFAPAARTDQAHQALRHDAVQRRYEAVYIHAHVGEAADHVESVVGVHGGEHQVPRERGLQGDLRGFGVADLPDHDLVRVVAQYRAQAPGEGEALLLVHRDLDDALELVFDRVLDGDDLLFASVELRQRRVQGRGLAAARGTGDQHHAVGLAHRAAELLQRLARHAEAFETQPAQPLRDRGLVEDADHHVLAVHTRDDRDPEVDVARAQPQLEAAVLRHALLGDIELGHHLEARNEGAVMAPVERLHRRVEHAVDAVLDRDSALVGLDVDVARALGEGVQEQRVDQPHHRARHVAELLERNGLLPALLGLLHHHEAEILGDALEHFRRALGALERGLDGAGTRKEQLYAQSGEVLEPVRQGEVVGIGERLGELLAGDDALAQQTLAELRLGFLARDLHLADEASLKEDIGQPAGLERMPHLMMSAMWNTGRYMTMMMPPMRSPISSISSGSISAMTRARRPSSTSS